uniref:Uncharacterized protein n=1 Tax=Mycena chlorophos TaxID=658473 RepID=A0ABQ0LSK2_MYCCL|nr:predicted protein [Mycena chlorophos]
MQRGANSDEVELLYLRCQQRTGNGARDSAAAFRLWARRLVALSGLVVGAYQASNTPQPHYIHPNRLGRMGIALSIRDIDKEWGRGTKRVRGRRAVATFSTASVKRVEDENAANRRWARTMPFKAASSTVYAISDRSPTRVPLRRNATTRCAVIDSCVQRIRQLTRADGYRSVYKGHRQGGDEGRGGFVDEGQSRPFTVPPHDSQGNDASQLGSGADATSSSSSPIAFAIPRPHPRHSGNTNGEHPRVNDVTAYGPRAMSRDASTASRRKSWRVITVPMPRLYM